AQYAKPFSEIQLMPGRLTDPLHWRKPCRVFVNSVSDLFHPKVPVEFIAKTFAMMLRAHQHTYLVLTKRGERCATLLNDERFRDKVFHELIYSGEYYCAQCQDWYECAGPLDHCPNCGHECDLGAYEGKDPPCPQCGEEVEYEMTCPKCGADGGNGGLNCTECWSQEIESNWMKWPPPNVHVGVSVSTQADLDEQVPLLLKCPAAVRFLSVEPLLGAMDLRYALGDEASMHYAGICPEGLRPRTLGDDSKYGHTSYIDGVIVGGESGPGARSCNIKWIRSIVRQCADADVLCFVKQWGSKPCLGNHDAPAAAPDANMDCGGTCGYGCEQFKLNHPKGANPAEWPEDLRVRELPR
ncbi:hypothetical protein LCGC14_2897980, partial [marine sediment metagenome]